MNADLFNRMKTEGRTSVFYGLMFTLLGLAFMSIAVPVGVVLVTAGTSIFVISALVTRMVSRRPRMVLVPVTQMRGPPGRNASIRRPRNT